MTTSDIDQLRADDLAQRQRKRDAKQRRDETFKVTLDGVPVLDTLYRGDALRKARSIRSSGVVFVTDRRGEVVFTRVVGDAR